METKTIPQRLSEEIVREITAGRYYPGQRLTEKTISEKYGISHIPAREALKLLEKDGFVTIYPYRGAVINCVNIEEYKQMVTLHLALLREITAGVSKHISQHGIQALEQILFEMKQSEANEDLYHIVINFVERLYSISRFEYLTGIIVKQMRLVTLAGHLYFDIVKTREMALEHYQETLRIAKTENAEALYQFRREYLEAAAQRFIKYLEAKQN